MASVQKQGKKKKTKFFYFTSLSFDNVFKTQVIGWVNLYRQRGLDYSIVKINPIKKISKRSNQKKEISEIRKLYDGPLNYIYLMPDRIVLGRLFNFFIYLFVFRSVIFSKVGFVLQTRILGFHPSLRMLKSLAPSRTRIIFDSRAAGAEEYIYKKDELTDEEKKTYEEIKNKEIKMVDISSRVFCVSSVLIDYHKKLKTGVNEDKFFLFPCSADQRFFYFDNKEREVVRSELKVTDRIVVVYSGGLAEPWHVPDKLFNFFVLFREKFTNAYFLLLTLDTKAAEKHRKEYQVSKDDFATFAADNKNVRKYLSASDLGLLLRDDVPMNNVASPTKFAEYLMCGLPTVISPNVGNFSEIIEEKKAGYVYDDTKDEKKLLREITTFSLPADNISRKETSVWATAMFSKQANLDNVLKIYSQLF